MSDVELFNTDLSPFGHRVRIMLAEKGIDYTQTNIDLADRPQSFYAISPYGEVPALRHGSDHVWESVTICEYLDEAFPSPPMMPATPIGRSFARIWMEFCNTRLMPAFRELIMEQDRARWSDLKKTVLGHLDFMEQHGIPDADPYWMGRHVGVVDVVFWPWFERFGLHTHYRGLEFPARCQRLSSWVGSCPGAWCKSVALYAAPGG